MSEVPLEKISVYAAEDVVMTYKLYDKYSRLLKAEDLYSVFETIEMPLIPALSDMEANGIKLNTQSLKEMSKKFAVKITELEKEIHSFAGCEFNVNSPAQLKKVLFEDLCIHDLIPKNALKKVKTGGYSTAASELEKLKGTHPIIDKISEYRELTKLKSTYIDALPELVDKKNNRVHTSFNQTVTATGRLSSSDPNLQNIPIRTEIGREIRKAFVADEGKYLLSADYSQIELRLAAYISGDKKMLGAFKEGEDIHARTASEIMGISLDAVTSEQRRAAKAINFGIIYGISAHGLSQNIGISREKARDYIDKYFEAHEGIKNYMEEIVLKAREKGCLETVFGRKRYIPEINSANFMVRAGAERMAINFPVQGTAADIMKLAMVNLRKRQVEVDNIKILLQVHDELVLEVDKDKVEAAGSLVKEIMESVISLGVPLDVNISYGENWGELKSFT
jgi:DNA polymerase-1